MYDLHLFVVTVPSMFKNEKASPFCGSFNATNSWFKACKSVVFTLSVFSAVGGGVASDTDTHVAQ